MEDTDLAPLPPEPGALALLEQDRRCRIYSAREKSFDARTIGLPLLLRLTL